jgi:fatty-acyl-CoA synthase
MTNAKPVSYLCGTSDEPLLYKTIGQALQETAASFGNQDALVVCNQGIRWSYEELLAKVDAFAAGLLYLGLKPGDRVGIWSPNNTEWVVEQLATARAGLILVNLNPAYRLRELEYALQKVDCKAVILAEKFKSSQYVQMIETLIPNAKECAPGQLKTKDFPSLETLIVIADQAPAGFFKFDEIYGLASDANRQSLADLQAVLQPDEAINIQFTSGTTGAPKGATLTHHNILNNGYFTAKRQSFTSKDRVCIPVPLYHCFGMVLGVLGCISTGACMVFPGEAFEPSSVLAACAKEKCTALYGVPTMFIAVLEHTDFGKFDLANLRTGVMAGASCPEDIMRRVMNEMHMTEVTIGYGMTETSPISTQSKADDEVEKRVTTVGQVHPFVEVKIIDENDRVLPRGQQGELLTRGYSVMLGYWGDEERSHSAIDQHGWMHSGDLAVIDEDGYVSITGRLKDMIIRGGENIYPREIEEYLYTHPKIMDVQVFGIPDQKFGEEVCAWIQLKEGETCEVSEITDFCKGQIAHFKIPKFIKFVTEYPMTVTGKIQKFEMRNATAKELGREVSS